MSEASVRSHQALADHGQAAIAAGSKSFALASLLFGRETKEDAQMLYAWCRHCDDVIDGQSLGGDAPDADLTDEEQAERLHNLKKLTDQAIAGTRTDEAAFDGFSIVVRKHDIPRQYPFDLLDGFSMDVTNHPYRSLDDTLQYCYGVAGSVGIMMAILMGVSKDDHQTLDRACDLGLAFQLTNICRDIIDDAKADRVYLPADLLRQNNIEPVAEEVLAPENRAALYDVVLTILDEADRYYQSASDGIRELPPRAASAVAAARNVYREIGNKVRQRGAHAWDDRTIISKPRKTWLALFGAMTGAPQSLFLTSNSVSQRNNLWSRPVR